MHARTHTQYVIHSLPMPVSVTCNTPASLSALILMDNSSVASSADLSVNDKNLILSKASEAFDISSLRKICSQVVIEIQTETNNSNTQITTPPCSYTMS